MNRLFTISSFGVVYLIDRTAVTYWKAYPEDLLERDSSPDKGCHLHLGVNKDRITSDFGDFKKLKDLVKTLPRFEKGLDYVRAETLDGIVALNKSAVTSALTYTNRVELVMSGKELNLEFRKALHALDFMHDIKGSKEVVRIYTTDKYILIDPEKVTDYYQIEPFKDGSREVFLRVEVSGSEHILQFQTQREADTFTNTLPINKKKDILGIPDGYCVFKRGEVIFATLNLTSSLPWTYKVRVGWPDKVEEFLFEDKKSAKDFMDLLEKEVLSEPVGKAPRENTFVSKNANKDMDAFEKDKYLSYSIAEIQAEKLLSAMDDASDAALL